MKIGFVTDSTSDVPVNLAREKGIELRAAGVNTLPAQAFADSFHIADESHELVIEFSAAIHHVLHVSRLQFLLPQDIHNPDDVEQSRRTYQQNVLLVRVRPQSCIVLQREKKCRLDRHEQHVGELATHPRVGPLRVLRLRERPRDVPIRPVRVRVPRRQVPDAARAVPERVRRQGRAARRHARRPARVDERIRRAVATDEISLGDYVITGGELPALIVVDAISRLLPGVLGDPTGALDDSHASGLLEYPHYTRPPEFRGEPVPEVLLSGDHARIARWRREQSLLRTLERRPDLLQKAELSTADRKFLKEHGWE